MPIDKAISVRMYNVGFGDCFLVRLPTEDGERRVLVDCGYHSLGKGKFDDKNLVRQIIEHLDGNRLDVVIATHRHQDHISAFGETEMWKDVAVEEVWLPFTARPGADKDDADLAAWHRFLAGVPDLCDAQGQLRDVAARSVWARTPDEQTAASWMLWNARSNQPAIDNLVRGMRNGGRAAIRRYLPEKAKVLPYVFQTPALPGVSVHVLGPPTDPAYRRKCAAPPAWGIGGDGNANANFESTAAGLPLGPEWEVPASRVPARPPFMPGTLARIRAFNDDAYAAAVAADGFLNGESLVLVLEIGKAKLLLTGDAEVGTWMQILSSEQATALAAGATFLKIGHHGSHNATPLLFLQEHLATGTPVMMSTQHGAGNYRNNIPRQEILEVLAQRGMPLARSDDATAPLREPFQREQDNLWIDAEIPC